MTTPIGAIILAAGNASRFGSLKQLALIDGRPMVRHVTCIALDAGFSPVVVVVGAEAQRVVKALEGLDITLVNNDAWESGMGGSLAVGSALLPMLCPQGQPFLVLLGDQPALRVSDFEQMLDAHTKSPHSIIVSEHAGDIGPPALFPWHLLAELGDLHGQQGARKLLARHQSELVRIHLPAAFQDIDEPADINRMYGNSPDA